MVGQFNQHTVNSGQLDRGAASQALALGGWRHPAASGAAPAPRDRRNCSNSQMHSLSAALESLPVPPKAPSSRPNTRALSPARPAPRPPRPAPAPPRPCPGPAAAPPVGVLARQLGHKIQGILAQDGGVLRLHRAKDLHAGGQLRLGGGRGGLRQGRALGSTPSPWRRPPCPVERAGSARRANA